MKGFAISLLLTRESLSLVTVYPNNASIFGSNRRLRVVAGLAVTVEGNANAAGANRGASSPPRIDSISLRSSASRPLPRICDLYGLKLRLADGDASL